MSFENSHLRGCDYQSIIELFQFYNVGEVRYNWTGKRAVQINAGKRRFAIVCFRPQNRKYGNFTLLFLRDDTELF